MVDEFTDSETVEVAENMDLVLAGVFETLSIGLSANDIAQIHFNAGKLTAELRLQISSEHREKNKLALLTSLLTTRVAFQVLESEVKRNKEIEG